MSSIPKFKTRNYSEPENALALSLQAPSESFNKCAKCQTEEVYKGYCHLIPDIGINSDGKIERMLCDFIWWLVNAGFPPPLGSSLETVNGIKLIPEEFFNAAKRVSKEGVPNFITRHANYLEACRSRIIKFIN